MADEKYRPIQDRGYTLLADLCNEAVTLFGPNWEAIERHVSNRLEGMDSPERTHLKEKIQQILGFHAPDRFRDGTH
ncbi:hypothetical protein [Methylosinus sp. Ce-a6]|uniref:hypothetical protein n=1 Tax=Methylosinus sp. Ce-a6 TaxID=2172005 RepID=UPI00135CD637|nr:hypothetical protein [Methylosinus sp. Ce-a6]